MSDDLIERIRTAFEDTEEVISWLDNSYEGKETACHISGLYDCALQAADRIEDLQKVMGALSLVNTKLIERMAVIENALDECLEYFENLEDVVDGDDGQPEANQAMQMAMMLKEILKSA